MGKFLRVVVIVLLFVLPAKTFATVTLTGSLSAFSTTYGTASASQSFTVSASGVTNSTFVVIAPTGYEVSLDNSNFNGFLSIPVVSGAVPTTTVYIRLAKTADAGTYAGSVFAAEIFIIFPVQSATMNMPSGTVNPYPITIKANDVHKTYGQTLSGSAGSTAYTITSGTLQNSETMGSVTIAYGAGAAATAAAGTYTGSVTPSAATGGTFDPNNYAITYATGNLIVDKAAITITANTVHKTYGQTLTGAAGSTAYAITSGSLKNSETIGSITIAYGAGAAATATAGTYTGSITPSAATGGTFSASNYTISYATGDLIIDKAAITITANTVHKTYGQTLTGAAGSTAYTITSGTLQNSETIGSITIAYGAGAAATATAGTYTGSITPSAATGGTFNASNYTISYATGDLIIDKAAITITANTVHKTYGQAL
ncbi:MBG domain-containing protein, partial [Mucilaginibacter panaciglaebae]|uniref:MBG domain-containing protein n=1 Tax=Mucilaginibacter panaciglaebae TaxID=502331 RepID=UPI0031EFB57D